MRKWITAAVCMSLVIGVVGMVTASSRYENIISIIEVEKATGIKGLKQVPRQKAVGGITGNKELTGDINFVQANDQPVIAVQFLPSFAFDEFKGDSGFIKAQVQGIGDEAYTGPSFDPQTSVNFVKGGTYVTVSTLIDPRDKKKAVLPIEQVIAVAKVIAARI